jgi:hypothetical protein
MATTITLKWPITFEGREVTELHMRPPKVEDQLAAVAAKGTDEEKEVRFFAAICEVPVELIGKLVIGDYKRLQGAFADFLS